MGVADEEKAETTKAKKIGCLTCNASCKRKGWICFVVVLLITGISVLMASLKKLKSTEYGLEYNIHKKQLDDAAKTGGLHAGPPGFRFIKFPSTFTSVDLAGTCISRDGLRVEYSVTFQYQMPKEQIVSAVLRYRNFDKWANVVESAGNSAVQHSCTQFNISNFQNKRGVIQSTMEENLRVKLEGTGRGQLGDGVFARAISLQLRNVELPSAYTEAVKEKQSAEEDIGLAKNQRLQETTKARTDLLAAEQQARKIINTAENDANVTLAQAKLKADETMFSFQKESEVILRVQSELNLTTSGVLAYLSNKLYEQVPNLKVSVEQPARISRKDEL